ncbi:uncharacterized protein LOC132268557 isoform X2 [Cornus florida]|uniref:uncharacterized protein LOC132268557 isoform X2 n=1 Tax=Cornus florida TaxID=4283 RepID=UPI00289F74EF|nr:uncharacterized protein LOC132268557 isoform X2 [Cornus florida]
MALRLLLRRNQWNTKKAGITFGLTNHRLCHSLPSPTTTGTTLGPNVHVPERNLADDIRETLTNGKITLEQLVRLNYANPHIGEPLDVQDAHKDDRRIFLAQLAVSMINDTRRDDSERVEFVRVVSAKWLRVNGKINCITLEAASINDDDRITKFYEAKFLKRRNCLKLMSWRELESPPITTQPSVDKRPQELAQFPTKRENEELLEPTHTPPSMDSGSTLL